jgi:hypothetical protein
MKYEKYEPEHNGRKAIRAVITAICLVAILTAVGVLWQENAARAAEIESLRDATTALSMEIGAVEETVEGVLKNNIEFLEAMLEESVENAAEQPETASSAGIVGPEAQTVERCAGVTMTDAELRDFAAIVRLEAGNQSDAGKQAVAEVILNRVIAGNFPDTVHDVLYRGAGTATPQFSSIGAAAATEPAQEHYDAIFAALRGPSILPADVVYFSRAGENDRVWGIIGDHVFCYQYEF